MKTSAKNGFALIFYLLVDVTSFETEICENFFGKSFQNLLVSHIEKLFSSFLKAYGKSYSTEHVLVRIIEERKNHAIV